MANSRSSRGLLPVPEPAVPPSHGMQGLPPPTSRLIATYITDHIKDQPGAYYIGELEQSLGFNLGKGPDPTERHQTANLRPTLSILPPASTRFDSTNEQHHQSTQVTSSSALSTDSRFSQYTTSGTGTHKEFESPSSRIFETWGDSGMANNSPRTDTSNDLDGELKSDQGHRRALAVAGNSDHQEGTKNNDSKALRRLAQNREAARKSRLRKKAYVQQLESSRLKLTQIEQELQRARQQGVFLGTGGFGGDQGQHPIGSNAAINPGAAAFDIEYARWVEEQHRQMGELRAALQAHASENELRMLVENGISHYDDLFRLKSVAAKADVFHLVSGMWKTPAERCFMWMGGFRPSELLKILIPQLEPLAEQQLLGICNLQQSSQQAEDALSQGMEALQQSLADTLASGSLGSSPNVANYMGQMAIAMGKLGTLENFVRQADNLRQQTLQQMHRLLTTRQAAKGLLSMADYFARLRALSSLWSARPRE
ncbi:hypothetical protein O6H91_07G105300 [Diphasiastrum complanatum]|uniref:Uncharacterized protein n=4 Tax=Diphasiastrum complanatum TaxID=34168 RepID=A0ACC2D8R1_DIPCM|nr:hypothetical protein O6H91_07G105300 [Diphasiastrum complanatum]KAJ7550539.1 hypothetical protein O6H91_07G105300 [Diphasiastrum complanatum]KAJ7550542.1 hypothetical protein O6H91_07G105300 [Diphasiastrum complanatum]KAJ7550547.1 hypothetical protein O6H91_07G105300 [Diphasiastrum complanatum]